MQRGNFSNSAATGRWAVLLLTALLLCAPGLMASAAAAERSLTFYNIHTKETTTVAFKRDGEYIPEGLKKLNHVMRDWRQDEPTDMDPELLDLIWEVYRELGSKKPIHLISGYRSEKTNNKLRRTVGGQAKKSQHILGKAADLHFPDVDVKTLRNSALVREVGGVGYYPKSGIPFVHMDTGRVRHWPRIPRMELAALFPDGKSQHVPSDGRPITLADYRRATESGKYPGPPQPVMVAAVEVKPQKTAPAPAPIQTASLPARKPEKTQVVTAGVTSDSLGAFMRAAGITGSLPEPVAPPANYKGSAMMQLASANASTAISAGFPTEQDVIASMRENMPEEVAQNLDEEHPEELVYEPFSVLPLMNATPVSHETDAIALVAPEFDNAGYLLSQPERRMAKKLTPRVGVQHVASAWQFTGAAVRNLVPSEPVPDPGPSRRVMTASTPAPPVPMGGPVGYSGGSTGFGFR